MNLFGCGCSDTLATLVRAVGNLADRVDALENPDAAPQPQRREIHHEGEHHDLCPWPHPTTVMPDPPCVCQIIAAAQLETTRAKRLEIVELRADLLRTYEALAALLEECEQLRRIKLLAGVVMADVARLTADRGQWSAVLVELAEAVGVKP